MSTSLKKIPWFKVFSKKRFVLLLSLAVLVLLVVPLQPALASWWEFLNPIAWVSGILSVIMKAILMLAKGLLQLANSLLGVAIGNPWGVSFTIPGDMPPANPIINIGWTLLRDLTNMFFILGLAYIGLATALNIAKFETKKTFFNLILIAVLINFTPVICGVVVDITNIISRFFLQGIDFKVLSDIFARQEKQVLSHFTDLIANPAIMMKALFLIAFGFIGAFVILLYSALFFVRAPIIWMLVIFSPLAFFAWIFKETNKYFKQWWGIFLQWAFIVIPCAFFLYLSQQVLARSKELVSFPTDSLLGNFLKDIAPYGVALFFMILGLIMTTKINAMGAGAVMGVTKTGLKKAGVTAGRLAKEGGKGIRNFWKSHREAQPKPGEEGYDKWSQEHKVSAGFRKAGRYMFGGETDEERARWEKPGAARAGRVSARALTSLYTFGAPVWARRATRKVAAQAEESTKKDMAEAKEKYKGKTITTKQAAIKNAGPGFLGRIQRVSALMAAIDDGDPLEHLGLEDWETKRIMQDATKFDPSSMFTIRNVNPFLAAEVANELKFTDAVKKQAGIHIKDEDKEKYQQELMVTEGSKEFGEMSEKERGENLYVDEQGKPILDANNKRQYKAYRHFTRVVTEDDLGIKAMSVNERESCQVMKDGKAVLDKDGKRQYRKDVDPLAAKLIAEVLPAKMSAWPEDFAKQIASSELIHQFWSGTQVGKAAELFGEKFLTDFRKKMEELGEKFYEQNNKKKLATYFTTTPARALGLDFGKIAGKAAAEEIQKEIDKKTSQIETKKEFLTKTMSEPERERTTKEIGGLIKELEDLQGELRKRRKTKAERVKAGELPSEAAPPAGFAQPLTRKEMRTAAKEKKAEGAEGAPKTDRIAKPQTLGEVWQARKKKRKNKNK